jgi:hypothetical protein
MLGRMQKALYREPAALYRAAEDCYNREALGWRCKIVATTPSQSL